MFQTVQITFWDKQIIPNFNLNYSKLFEEWWLYQDELKNNLPLYLIVVNFWVPNIMEYNVTVSW